MLLENEIENEDLLSLSHTLRANVKISYDLKTLLKSDNIYDVEPELVDPSITDAMYLEGQRRRAETKIIKSKILYKLYNQESREAGNFNLTKLEQDYLAYWTNDLKENKERNVLNLRDTLVNEVRCTALTFNDLDANDLYTLNTISKV
jgi:hypothetical protein